jgi:acyl carrier protein
MTSQQVLDRLEASEVLPWVVSKFAEWLEVPPEDINPERPIASYGLDSISAVTLSVYLEEELGFELETALLWEHPTLASLSAHLAGEMSRHGLTRLPHG